VRRMRVAPGTGDLRPEENASDVLRKIAWIAGQSEKIRWPDLGEFSCGGEKGPGDLIERCVAGHLLAQPMVISACACFATTFAANEQQIGELHGPVVHEVLPPQKIVND